MQRDLWWPAESFDVSFEWTNIFLFCNRYKAPEVLREWLVKQTGQVQIVWQVSCKGMAGQRCLYLLALSRNVPESSREVGSEWGHSYTSSHIKDLLPDCRGDRQPFVSVPKARQGSLTHYGNCHRRVMAVGTEPPQVKRNQLLWKQSSIPSILPGPQASEQKDRLSPAFSPWLQSWLHW